MSNGKGSGRRPAAVDDARVASEWDRIFGPKPEPNLMRAFEVLLGPRPLQRPAETISFAGPVPGAALRRMIDDVASEPREQ